VGLSTLEAPTGAWTANTSLIPAGANGGIAVKPTAATDLLVDVSGYFDGNAAGLAFYPMSP
jgi:hypothetical protein